MTVRKIITPLNDRDLLAYPWVLNDVQQCDDVRTTTKIIKYLNFTFYLLLFDRLWRR